MWANSKIFPERWTIPALPAGDPPAIEQEKLRLLYANSAIGLVASFALATVLVTTHWPVVSHPVLLAWWSSMVLLTSARAVCVARFRRSVSGTSSASPWFAWHSAGVALSGVAWGAAGILLFTPDSDEHQAFLSLTLAGMVAGAVPIHAASRASFLAFALPTCLPIVARFFLMGDWLHMAMGTAGIIFVGIMTGLVWSLNRGLVRTFELSAERRQAEEALRTLNTRLDFLLSSSPATIYTCEATPPYAATFISTNLTALLGYTVEEFLATPGFWADHIHPDDNNRVFAELPHLFSHGSHLHEYRFQHKDGSWRWMRDALRVVPGPDGKATELIGYFIDITERKTAEAEVHALNENLEHLVDERTEKLRESEGLFRTLAQVAPVGIFRTNATGYCVYMNERWCDIAGMSVDTAVGFGWAAALHPDDRDRVSEEWAQAIRSRRPFMSEYRFQTAEQKITWVVGQAQAELDQHGAVVGYVGTITDITERKKAFEREIARTRALRQLSKLSLQLSGTPDEVFRHTVRMIGELFAVRVVCLSEIVGRDLSFRAVYLDGEVFLNAGGCPLDVTPCATVEATKDLRLYDQVAERFPQASFLLDHNAQAYCGFPSLDVAGRVVAVTCLLDDKPREFSEEDQEILRIIGQRIATEVERTRAEAEQTRLLAVLEASLNEIYMFDTNTLRFTYVNRGARENLGYTLDALLELTPVDLKPEFTDATFRAHIAPLLRHEQSQLIFQTVHERADGTRYPVEVHLQLVEQQHQHQFLAMVFDITERKRAEETLRESEERYRLITDATFDGIVIHDQGIMIEVNPGLERMFGYAPGELIGKHILDIVADESREMVIANMKKGAQGPYESVGRRKDGSTFYGEVVVKPYRYKGREARLVAGRDITERKQTESAMQFLSTGITHLRGEAFFSEMAVQIAKLLGLEIGFVGKLLTTPALRIRTVGLAIDGQARPPVEYELARTPCERVIGKQTAIFPEQVQQLFPDDQMLVDLGISSYAAIPLFGTNGDAIGHVGVMSRRPLRQIKQVEDLLRLFAVSAAAELERQRTETKFHDLFEFSPDAILMVNQEGLITLANRQAQSLFGYSWAEFLNLPVETLIPDTERQGHVHLRQQFFSAATPRMMGADRPSLSALKKNGTIFPVDINLSPIQSEEGLQVAVAVRDITERKEADAALQAFQEQIRQMQKMEALGQLAGGVAHDFNNILTAILGNAEMACAKIAPGHPSRPNLTSILEAGDRASRLVQQILTFSHQQTFSRTVQALSPVVHEALALLRTTLPAGIELTTTCDVATPHVLADATQIHQIVMNLCTNARHALQEQPGRIAVDLAPVTLTQPLHSLHATLPPGRYARLSVHDTGCGMDSDTMLRIFDPFFTTKPIGQGTGLGLSVIHGIVQGHDGAIVVESQPGRGTTFDIYFPAVEGPFHASERAPTAPVPIQKRQCHLLYLDEEKMLVELVRAKFTPLGYRISGYTEPAKALAAICADPTGFDVVVTDYNMRGMSGLEVAGALRQIRADLPVVLVSESMSPEIATASLAAGIKKILYKPSMLKQLGDVLAGLTHTSPHG